MIPFTELNGLLSKFNPQVVLFPPEDDTVKKSIAGLDSGMAEVIFLGHTLKKWLSSHLFLK